MEIKEKIENILKEIVPDINLSSDDLMNEKGMGSLTVIQLISELDMVFDIEITFEDILNNRFHSVEAIEEMVNAYLKKN